MLTELLARFPRSAADPAAGTFAAGHHTRRYATLPVTTGAQGLGDSGTGLSPAARGQGRSEQVA